MAEDQNLKDDKQKDNENDPYNFFKFAGPKEPEKDDGNKNKKKKGFPFLGILLIGLLVITFVDLLFLPKNDSLIDYSDFRSKVENGQITYVEIGENYIIGYSEPVTVPEDQEKGLKLFSVDKKGYRQEYKTAAVLMQSFIDLLDEKGVQYKFVQKQNNVLLQLLLNLIFPFGLIFLEIPGFQLFLIHARLCKYRNMLLYSHLQALFRKFFDWNHKYMFRYTFPNWIYTRLL